MPFPRKFKQLLEATLDDIVVPDYVWLSYAVCATEQDSCGWSGWSIEGAFKKSTEKHSTAAGDKVLEAIDQQICPRCGKDLFRTESVKFEPSVDQTPPLVVGLDYETAPMDYED